MSVLFCLGLAMCCQTNWCVVFYLDDCNACIVDARFYEGTRPPLVTAPPTRG